MASQPGVQASYMRNLFAALAAHPEPALLERVREADPELVAEMSTTGRIGWLPVGWNTRTVRVLTELLGEERGLHVLADCVTAQFDTPLWKSFVSGALRLLGRDPASLGRWIPSAMKLVFRGCGVFSVEVVDPEGELRVDVSGMPPMLAHDRVWVRSLGIGLAPLLQVCELSGDTDLVSLDADAGTARLRVRWKPDGAPPA